MAQAQKKPAAKTKSQQTTTRKKRVRSGATRRPHNQTSIAKAITPDEVINPQADKGPQKKKRANSYEPTEADRAEVKQMVAIGCSQDSIAIIKRIDVKTLRRHFPEELSVGVELGAMKLRHAQFDEAVEKRNASLLIWLGKNMLGQTDKVEGQGMGGDIVQYKVEINLVGAK